MSGPVTFPYTLNKISCAQHLCLLIFPFYDLSGFIAICSHNYKDVMRISDAGHIMSCKFYRRKVLCQYKTQILLLLATRLGLPTHRSQSAEPPAHDIQGFFSGWIKAEKISLGIFGSCTLLKHFRGEAERVGRQGWK